METVVTNGLLVVKLNLVQTTALAILVYFIGQAIRNRIPWLIKTSIPAPVVGGLLFALLATYLRMAGILGFEFDGNIQKALMIMFFCTIGMGASVMLLKKGGLPLIIFFAAACVLAVLQNVLGIFVAKLVSIHPLFGIVAGAITLMGGLGTAGAFGPLFEEWGLNGATTAAIACATFGMVAGSLMGGPFGETILKRYKVKAPGVARHEAAATATAAQQPNLLDQVSATDGTTMMKTLAWVVVAMGFGTILSSYIEKAGITLPAYIGSMIVAALFRNFGDLTKAYKIDEQALDIISDISLALYITMAINGLKLWELLNLAVPLLIILLAQCVLMLVFCWLGVFLLMGRDYEAMMLSVGMIGFGMGATPNALVNMQALSQKYGPAPKAFFIVPLVGAFLIDFANALIITGMGSLYR